MCVFQEEGVPTADDIETEAEALMARLEQLQRIRKVRLSCMLSHRSRAYLASPAWCAAKHGPQRPCQRVQGGGPSAHIEAGNTVRHAPVLCQSARAACLWRGACQAYVWLHARSWLYSCCTCLFTPGTCTSVCHHVLSACCAHRACSAPDLDVRAPAAQPHTRRNNGERLSCVCPWLISCCRHRHPPPPSPGLAALGLQHFLFTLRVACIGLALVIFLSLPCARMRSHVALTGGRMRLRYSPRDPPSRAPPAMYAGAPYVELRKAEKPAHIVVEQHVHGGLSTVVYNGKLMVSVARRACCGRR